MDTNTTPALVSAGTKLIELRAQRTEHVEVLGQIDAEIENLVAAMRTELREYDTLIGSAAEVMDRGDSVLSGPRAQADVFSRVPIEGVKTTDLAAALGVEGGRALTTLRRILSRLERSKQVRSSRSGPRVARGRCVRVVAPAPSTDDRSPNRPRRRRPGRRPGRRSATTRLPRRRGRSRDDGPADLAQSTGPRNRRSGAGAPTRRRKEEIMRNSSEVQVLVNSTLTRHRG